MIAELIIPNEMPTMEMGIASKKTPMKNPKVTIEQEERMRREGRACRRRYDVPTVRGRTRPRATW